MCLIRVVEKDLRLTAQQKTRQRCSALVDSDSLGHVTGALLKHIRVKVSHTFVYSNIKYSSVEEVIKLGASFFFPLEISSNPSGNLSDFEYPKYAELYESFE